MKHEFFVNGVLYEVRFIVAFDEHFGSIKQVRACVIRRLHDHARVASPVEVPDNETGFETGWEEQQLENCLGLMFAGDKDGEKKARADITDWLAEVRKEKK